MQLNRVEIIKTNKDGLKHVTIIISNFIATDCTPKDNIKIGSRDEILKNAETVYRSFEYSKYSDNELLIRANRLQMEMQYNAFFYNCEHYKNELLHGIRKSETKKIIFLGLSLFASIVLLSKKKVITT